MLYYRKSMVNEKGEIRSYDNFVKHIADSGEVFNSTFLRTEYEHAYYSTIMADKWDRFADDEILEYSTVGDGNVRPSHALLDKFTAPKNHGFWNKNYPPNGWNCRCTVVPGKSQNVTNTQQDRFSAGMRQLKVENKNSLFHNNVGSSKLIFDGKHPYYNNSNTELTWKEYGLQNIEKLKLNPVNPELIKTSKEEYFNWWNTHKNIEDDIVAKDRFGSKVILKGGDSKSHFKNHIIHEHDRKKSENRYEYATESLNILSDPDEVWFSEDKKTGGKIFIKYYENYAIKLVVSNNNIADSIYILDDKKYSGSVGKARRGLLLYKK